MSHAASDHDFAVTTRIEQEAYRTSIESNGHALVADEPVDMGGGDSGPDPYALLLASLGACKAITIRMYADRKEWPLAGATVRLRHSRIDASHCEDCQTETGQIDRIDCEIELEGDLDDEQRQRLVQIADRCPVHRTLTTETKVHSILAGAGQAT